MVYTLYIAGTKFSGKTALSLGIYNSFNEMGMRVGYFKPIGQGYRMVEGRYIDPDVIMMKDVIGLNESIEELCPVVLGSRYLDLISKDYESLRTRIMESYEKVKKDKDILIIEAAQTPEMLFCSNLDVTSLAKEFGAKIIFSVKGDNDSSADKALLYSNYMVNRGVDVIGIIINFVPFQQLERMRGVVSDVLCKCNVNVFGIVPDHRELTLPTVQDVVNSLEAEVLAGKSGLDRIVDNYLVGAMSPEAAMSWLRRSVDRAFITGGDRADLILMAIETKPSAIILTGNIYPSAHVISAAESKGIPLLLVADDTFTTVTKLEPLDGRIVSVPMSTRKIQLTRKIMSEYIDWKNILEGYVDFKNRSK
jgi:BioD-like phosphotransacetylase family protein